MTLKQTEFYNQAKASIRIHDLDLRTYEKDQTEDIGHFKRKLTAFAIRANAMILEDDRHIHLVGQTYHPDLIAELKRKTQFFQQIKTIADTTAGYYGLAGIDAIEDLRRDPLFLTFHVFIKVIETLKIPGRYAWALIGPYLAKDSNTPYHELYSEAVQKAEATFKKSIRARTDVKAICDILGHQK